MCLLLRPRAHPVPHVPIYQLLPYIATRFGVQGETVATVMLDNYFGSVCGAITNKGIMRPPAISMRTIKQLLDASPLAGLRPEDVSELLLNMHQDRVPLLDQREMKQGPAGFAVNVMGILEDIRLQRVKQVVATKFGGNAARMYQILVDEKMLEEKQVSLVLLYVCMCV